MKHTFLSAFCLLITVLFCVNTGHAAYTPVVVNGFTDDIIANGVGNANASTTIGVDGAGWTLVAQNFQATVSSPAPLASLPNSGTINSVATAGLTFQLANYTGNNGIRLATASSTQTLTFTTPIGGDVYILGFAGDAATGGINATITITFTDNTTQVFSNINFADWYNGTGFTIQNIGRVNRNNNTLENPTGNPRLYERLLTLSVPNQSKQIANINILKTTATGVLNILAVSVNTLCNAPTGLTSSGITTSSANFSWSPVAGSAGYEYALTSGPTPPASGTATSVTSYSASGLTQGTNYCFHVRNSCGTSFSGWTTTCINTLCNVAAPTGLNASGITHNSANTSWSAVSGATGYEYAVNTSPTPPSTGTPTGGTTYSPGGLTAATIYYLHVRAVCGGSTYSSWTTYSFTTSPPPPCVSPVPLTVTNITATSADLGWLSLTGVAGYEYAVTTSATPPASGTNTISNTYSYPGLTPGTAYYAHVRTDCGASNFSSWTSTPFTTLTSCDPPVATIGNITDTTADITWNAIPGAQTYEHHISSGSAPPASGTGTTTTSYNAKQLTRNTNYYLHLRTMCSANNSTWATTSFKTANVTSISQLNKDNIELDVYPNPASDKLNINIINRNHIDGTVTLTDITGRFISQTAISKTNTAIDVSTLSPGVYILKYQDGTGIGTIRVIKE